jgi:regulator of protease activity HflC (stomatin/prohibitin superfamily)
MQWLVATFGSFRIGLLGLLVLLVISLSTTVVPAGHVGVQDFFGRVSDRILPPGINVIVPGPTSSSSACRRES